MLIWCFLCFYHLNGHSFPYIWDFSSFIFSENHFFPFGIVLELFVCLTNWSFHPVSQVFWFYLFFPIITNFDMKPQYSILHMMHSFGKIFNLSFYLTCWIFDFQYHFKFCCSIFLSLLNSFSISYIVVLV